MARLGEQRLGFAHYVGVALLRTNSATVTTMRSELGAASHAGPVDSAYVVARLEDAGRTLLCLPNTGYSTRMRSSALEVLRAACELDEPVPGKRLRPPIPSAVRIGDMDRAWSWLGLNPTDRYVLRRIVGARALVSPMTERHLFSWRRLGGLLGADHRAVQRWHGEGIGWIVKGLASASRSAA